MCSLDSHSEKYATFADQQRYSSMRNYDMSSRLENYKPISTYRGSTL